MKESKNSQKQPVESPFLEATPCNTPAPWVGGKRLLAKRIIAKIQERPHNTYVEPFIGMGGVFLRRPFQARCEVINDYSQDVANLFRILQRHYVPFIEMIKWRLTSRSEFNRLMKSNPDTLTDLERAARFIYLQKLSFGGKNAERNFAVERKAGARFNLSNLETTLQDVHERLNRVVIEFLPWQKVIEKYNRENVLFYLDPPYYGVEDYYEAVFKRSEFEEMAEVLSQIKGRFILSINDTQEVRKIFGKFKIEEIPVTYSLSKSGPIKTGELIISN